MDQRESAEPLNEYKKFFDEAIVGLCRWDIKSGRFLMANPHCAQMLGYSTPKELIASSETITKLAGREEKQKLLNRLKKEGEVEGYELPLEVNGKTIWVSAYVHINCGGTCVQGTLLNITSQKKSEFEIDALKTKQLIKLNGIRDKLDTMMTCYE